MGLQEEVTEALAKEPRVEPGSTTSTSIFPFPDILSGVEEVREGTLQPILASFGPYHNGRDYLRPFEGRKIEFRNQFQQRRGRSQLTDPVRQLLPEEGTVQSTSSQSISDCYKKLDPRSRSSDHFRMLRDPNSMPSNDFREMMLTDGCFIVELLHQYADNTAQWPWDGDHQYADNPAGRWPRDGNHKTLIADLLKLENQLPFIVLEKMYYWSCSTGDEDTTRIELRKLALRFFYEALGRPLQNMDALDMVLQNMETPKHLLDLFRRSLVLQTPSENNSEASELSIQRAQVLCEDAGITLWKNDATSLLEIDFRKLHFPPFALKIPHLAIDNPTTVTILMNCIALELSIHDTPKHFTAYLRFMYCLLKEHDDVSFLRRANIITCIRVRDDDVIGLLDKVWANINFNPRDCYLQKQYLDINSFHGGRRAYIWLKFTLPLVVLLLAILGWLFNLLFTKK